MGQATTKFVDRVRDELVELMTAGAIPPTSEGLQFAERCLDRLVPTAGTPAFEHHASRAASVNRVTRDLQIHQKKLAVARVTEGGRTKAASPTEDRDDLLPVLRRGAFDRDFPGQLRDVLADGLPLGLLFLDVDHFKRVNDTLGHPKGDAVLRAVAAQIVKVIGFKGVTYRYGGDEFCTPLRHHEARNRL